MKRIHPDDVGLVDCADCGRALLCPRTAAKLDAGTHTAERATELMPRVAGRILGRPYCYGCIRLTDVPVVNHEQ